VDLILSSPGASVSRRYVPNVVRQGSVVVIDNTSAFRMEERVPLVIPEINAADIRRHEGIIANPNCSAIIMLMAVYPLYRASRIKRLVVATYQSASGAGAKAMRELYDQTAEFVASVKATGAAEDDMLIELERQMKKPLPRSVFPHQIAFNLFSHNSPVSKNGYTEEENKIIDESRKILHDASIRICPTTIRVPVFRAHSEAIVVEFERKMGVEEARSLLSQAAGVRLVDERERNLFPMPLEASGLDDVLVGRIRDDLSSENGLALFVSGDQLRKGAALNSVQIAERLIGAPSP
jgi:aspartate-semialdehyde dehydrogenase